MGGTPRIYVRPIPDYPTAKWRSTFLAHTRRNPPSREPGVDYYCPLGTTLVSIGDGVVTEVGGGVVPATGRYVRVRLDNGQGFRLLHLGPRHSLKRVGDRVKLGEPLAISGASGYGSEYFGASNPYDAQMILNTGGPHTHLSLFPRWNAAYAETIDPEPWMMDPTTAGGGSSPLEPKEWDEMATKEEIADLIRKNTNSPGYRLILMTVPGWEGQHWHIWSDYTGIAVHVADASDLDRFTRLEAEPGTMVNLIPSDLSQLKARYFDRINPPVTPASLDIDEADVAARVIAALSPEILAQKLVEHGIGEAVVEAIGKAILT